MCTRETIDAFDSTSPHDIQQDATTMDTTRRLKAHNSNCKRLTTYRVIHSTTQREESIVEDLTNFAQERRAFNLISLLRRERGQIGSWPTAQAE
jgi:hypothetical protein